MIYAMIDAVKLRFSRWLENSRNEMIVDNVVRFWIYDQDWREARISRLAAGVKAGLSAQDIAQAERKWILERADALDPHLIYDKAQAIIKEGMKSPQWRSERLSRYAAWTKRGIPHRKMRRMEAILLVGQKKKAA